jgi:predicted phosphodiesterase
MKTRLTFFATSAVLLAIVLIPADGAKALEIIKGPYLQKVTENSIVIMWETDDASNSRVDYGLDDPPDDYYEENSENEEIHEIELTTGLAADTMYYYKVTSGTETSEIYTFYTAPDTERSFRFVAYGDNRSDPSYYFWPDYHEYHDAVIQGIIDTPGGAPEFVIHTGDLVRSGRNYEEWAPQFFGPAYDLMVNTPLLPVLGNHEYSGSGQLWHLDFFSVGNNDQWFAFTYGGVRFIGLNTCVDYSPGSDQYKWLVGYYEGEEWIPGEFQSTEYQNATWHIVFFHHPAYSSGSHGGTQDVQDYLVEEFEKNGVDIVFNGHDHIYEVSLKDGVYYVVTGGGGAPLRPVNQTSNPYKVYNKSPSIFHHCVIDVTDTSLTLSARDNNGDEFHSIELGCLRNIEDQEYADWEDWGRPDCWCYQRQCRGDTDGQLEFGRPVGLLDLNLLKAAFGKDDQQLAQIPNGICADVDHEPAFGKRVALSDLNILKDYFGLADVPACDAEPINTGPYNFWTSP